MVKLKIRFGKVHVNLVLFTVSHSHYSTKTNRKSTDSLNFNTTWKKKQAKNIIPV
jgi:hypothetical protein